MITKEKRSTKPRECRGGILADEMGMGKPLTLIALINAYSERCALFGTTLKSVPAQGKRGEAAPRSTLIIAPKSSIGPCSSATSPCLAAC